MPVSYSGPLFDGRAKAALKAGVDATEEQVALAARDAVRDEVRRRARQRTGYYESRVQVENLGGDRVVNASGLVYDDWLQGNAPRNSRSTFKGYQQWDRAKAVVDARAVALVEQTLKPYLGKMG